ncbi:MAG: MFS transporter [Desulfurococcales archaeon]|nr:MFS transporter [Desulfurococcales archaeon]
MRKLLLSIAIVAFSVMFSISIVGPLLSSLAEAEGIPLGDKPNTSIGIIFSLGGFSLALFQIPLARLADRLGRKWFVFWGSLGVALSVLLIGYAREVAEALGLHVTLDPLGWDESTIMLALARTLQGIAAAATWPVLLSILASELPVESMGTAMGVFGASFGLGMSLGPVAGPGVSAKLGIHAPFILSAVLAVLAALASLAIKETRAYGERRSKKRASVRDPRLISLGLVAFTLLYAMGALVVIYPRYMTSELGLSLGDLAVAMALASLTYSLLQPLTGRLADIVDRRLLVVVSHPLAGIAVLLAGLSKDTLGIYASMLLFGLAGALTFPAATALLGSIAPKGLEGTYTGIYNAMLSFGVTISPITVGLLADYLGYKAAFASVFPTVLAATVTFILLYRRPGHPLHEE